MKSRSRRGSILSGEGCEDNDVAFCNKRANKAAGNGSDKMVERKNCEVAKYLYAHGRCVVYWWQIIDALCLEFSPKTLRLFLSKEIH